MKLSTTLLVLAAAAAAAACSDRLTQPQHARVPLAKRGVITCDAGCGGTTGGTVPTATDSALTVTMSGPTKVLTPATATFTSNVSGGTAPYHYIWTYQICYDAGVDCSEDIFAEGDGLSSVSLPIYSDMNTIRVVVQVKDAVSPAAHTGNAHFMVLGPTSRTYGSTGAFACQSPVNFYPFWGYLDPHTGDPVGQYYIRSGCDGHKIMKPDSV
jgi:hypothetical protein